VYIENIKNYIYLAINILNRMKTNMKIILVCQNILFHYYRKHKNELTAFRLWFISRFIIDCDGSGSISIEQLANVSKLSLDYVRRYCKNSDMFRGTDSNKIYYCSLDSLLKKHHLTRRLQIRGERNNKPFVRQFQSKKMFIGYIIKCYVERDLSRKKPRNFTCGRISYQNIADYFNISRMTAITNLKIVKVKKFKNIRTFYDITFDNKKEYGYWLLINLGNKIGDYIVENNISSYQLRYINGKFVLVQHLPNIFKFTGTFLKNRSRGNSKRILF
jgi:hypothetical protein